MSEAYGRSKGHKQWEAFTRKHCFLITIMGGSEAWQCSNLVTNNQRYIPRRLWGVYKDINDLRFAMSRHVFHAHVDRFTFDDRSTAMIILFVQETYLRLCSTH
jgi:hypothetical protein